MLRDRLFSAAVAILIIVPLLIWGGVLGVAILVAVFGGFAAWELSRNLSALKTSPARELTILAGLGVVAALHSVPAAAVPAVVVGCPLLILFLHLLLYDSIKNTLESAPQMMLVCAYVTIPLGHAVLLRRLDMGIEWVFYVLAAISIGDTGAYFAGKYYGKHHFSKQVSPGKTVEGLIGGLAGNFLGMLIVKTLAPGIAPFQLLIPLTLFLAVLGPLGDLTASAIKRRLQIKDFGFIMPGHGGVLDRADALIPAFPAVYYVLILCGAMVSA